MLSYLVRQHSIYRQFYQDRAREGDYIILDNSAHEFGSATHWEDLIELGEELNVSEIVLPDRLFFGEDTYNMSKKAFKLLRSRSSRIRTMGAPQGRTPQEFLRCLFKLLDLGVDTIGISKDFEVWPGGLRALVEDVCRESNDVDIHLLGWGRDLRQLFLLGSCPWLRSRIRGVDSAKPIVFAAQGIRLPSSPWETLPAYPTRPDDFFSLASIPEHLLLHNISVFQAWAKGEIPS